MTRMYYAGDDMPRCVKGMRWVVGWVSESMDVDTDDVAAAAVVAA